MYILKYRSISIEFHNLASAREHFNSTGWSNAIVSLSGTNYLWKLEK